MKWNFLLLSLCTAAVFPASSLARNADVSIVRVPNGGIQPQAVRDGAGTLHLLYYAGDPMLGDLFYVKSSTRERSGRRLCGSTASLVRRLPRGRSEEARSP